MKALSGMPIIQQSKETDMAGISDVMKKRRSVRSHSDKPIEREKLERIIEAANHAPSASNAYPWKIVVVQNKGLIRKTQSVSPGMLGSPADGSVQ
jgi:nitroreductase